jgi:hypothetical protein
MIEVSTCVICEGLIRRLKRALIAPFLARRIWNRKPFCVDLVQCSQCGFAFYNPRLDDNDLRALYSNYRSEDYQRQRHAAEPWYTAKFNFNLASPDSYVHRRATLAPILKQNLDGRPIHRVLDHGGDRGDLVVGLFDGARAFVYDISGVAPAAGVTPVADPSIAKADLTINSNVLEHVGFPRQMVRDILASAPEGGLVYLEVPCEAPLESVRILRRIAQIGVVALSRPSLAPQILRPSALYMMHEHINYYNEKTLTTLMRFAGGAVIASGQYRLSNNPADAPVGWCLGRKA